jgi:ABC-2 type transport system permease protein
MNSDSFSSVLLSTCYIMILIVPALTMKSFAEERKSRTDQMLLCAPVKIGSIVCGKYAAALSVMLIALGMTAVFPILIAILGKPYPGEIIMGYIGCFLVGACMIAVGLFVSSVTVSQLSCAVTTTVVLLFLFLANNVGPSIPVSALSRAVCAISPFYYINMFRMGLLMPTSVAFLISFATVFIVLTVIAIDRRVWRKH